jgi:hypothetical protein
VIRNRSPTAAIDPGTATAAIVEPAAAAAVIHPTAATIYPRAAAIHPGAAAIYPAAASVYPRDAAISPSASAATIDPAPTAIDPTGLCLGTRHQNSQYNPADHSLRPFLQALKETPSAYQLDFINVLLHNWNLIYVFTFGYQKLPAVQSRSVTE